MNFIRYTFRNSKKTLYHIVRPGELLENHLVLSEKKYFKQLYCTSVDTHHVENYNTITDNNGTTNKTSKLTKKIDFSKGPGLSHFISSNTENIQNVELDNIPYLPKIQGNNQKVYIEMYGCQMNVSDAEIVLSILKSNGYLGTENVNDADIILLVTCAIRDKAEQRIWNRLRYLRHLKKVNQKKFSKSIKVGLLGCMAERLKHKIIEEEKIVDVVAGPDSYKDLPRLLSITDSNEAAINVALSLDETYADITPVRLNPANNSAFVSIMRGCDNMCTYCIVPFTRGRERSRPITSILNEVQILADQGVKEITLLGQNVNSYRDTSESQFYTGNVAEETKLAKGFKTVYKSKKGGLRFSDLLDEISNAIPEIRIRFTSPHPKDFPDEVLQLILERPNICQQLHIPVQSGNSAVLERMRRGYTREAYLDLVNHIRDILPEVALSSDFICGFCDETEEEFQDTLSMIELVKYSKAFLFHYSMREKTTAHRRFKDSVPEEVKKERLIRMIQMYIQTNEKLLKTLIGTEQLVLVEGKSKKYENRMQGRTDGGIRVILSNTLVNNLNQNYLIQAGDYIVTNIKDVHAELMFGDSILKTTLRDFYSRKKEQRISN